MADRAGTAETAGVDVRETGRRVEQLLDSLASATEPQLRMHAEELVGLLVNLYGEGLSRMMSFADDELLTRWTEDELVSELMVLHGLHPVDIQTRVREAVSLILPTIGVAARVQVIDVDAAGVARLHWAEASRGCGASSDTGPKRLEAALLATISDVTAVEIQREAEPRPPTFIPVESLFQHRPAGADR